VLAGLGAAETEYLNARLEAARARIPAEPALVELMQHTLGDRPLADYTTIRRPDVLPPELSSKKALACPRAKPLRRGSSG